MNVARGHGVGEGQVLDFRRLERWVADVLETLPDAFFAFDDQVRILYMNRAAHEVLGAPRDQAVGRELFALRPALRGTEWERRLREMARTSEPVEFEAASVLRPGRWYRARLHPSAEGFSLSLADVTAQRATRDELEGFFALSHELLAAVSREGRILRANPSLARALGVEPAALLARPLVELVHPEDAADVELALTRVAAGVSFQARESRFLRADGGVRRLDWNAVRGAGGACLYFSARDVTDARLLEEQLLQAQKMESIGRLAGGIAHDFNNLLSVILAVGGLIRADVSESDPMHADIDEILDAARRAATLTRQLLAFSRKQVIQPQVLDAAAVVRESEKMLRRILGEDIVFDVHLAPLATLRADPAQLEQVLVNLAVNARDAMPLGGRLRLKVAVVDVTRERARVLRGLRPGRHVRLCVADTGVGMDEATRERIFEPFFTTKPAGKGTGLGLSTVYGIVTQAGGAIEVLTAPGMGSTFCLYFPEAEPQHAGAPSRPGEQPTTGHETILLVEDDPAVRRSTRRMLERLGYHVIEASNGAEAVHLAESVGAAVELLLTDVVMPGLSGPQLAAAVRVSAPGARVVYMSGHPEETVLGAGILDPSVNFLYKPLDADRLARLVRDALDR
jgi:PAS domain S-box-containing protein